jgi:predicted Rossmann fold flavoprotein
MKKIAIVGAGAAGYFAAIQVLELNPALELRLYEKSTPLAKVKVSGGGRCNVTHACFDPNELMDFYPRGSKELRGPFHHFQPGDMMDWLSGHGVELKIEEDGRVFPTSNQSQSIIECFQNALPEGVLIKKGIKNIVSSDDGEWTLEEEDGDMVEVDAVIVATGSSEQMWKMLDRIGVSMVPRVPSLFTFNIQDQRLWDLSGLSLLVSCQIEQLGFETDGPMLITHWGLSGPAILKMSAFAAVDLAKFEYIFNVRINSLPLLSESAIEELLQQARRNAGKKQIRNHVPFQLPMRWWHYLLGEDQWTLKNWGDIKKEEILFCIQQLTKLCLPVNGKSIFKEEFVTAGGVDLKNVNFKTMESKTHSGLYFAGEVLNIDGVTGGFNFQSCWTTAYIAAQAVSRIV